MIVVSDHLTQERNLETIVNSPSEADIVRLIKRLDQERYTSVTLQEGSDQHLIVGGGKGQYIVYATPDNLSFFTVTHAETPNGERVILSVGGQEGEYAANMVVNEETAIACALTYFRTGRMDARFVWHQS